MFKLISIILPILIKKLKTKIQIKKKFYMIQLFQQMKQEFNKCYQDCCQML